MEFDAPQIYIVAPRTHISAHNIPLYASQTYINAPQTTIYCA
jgi:hypothetical protein